MLAAPERWPDARRKGRKFMPEGRMNQRLRDLIQELGEAIHESVIESEEIAGVVKDIRRHGFDVVLMLEATIGLNDVANEENTLEASVSANSADGDEDERPFNSNDLNFLKRLRISVEGEE
jgi:hypothetical protein